MIIRSIVCLVPCLWVVSCDSSHRTPLLPNDSYSLESTNGFSDLSEPEKALVADFNTRFNGFIDGDTRGGLLKYHIENIWKIESLVAISVSEGHHIIYFGICENTNEVVQITKVND